MTNKCALLKWVSTTLLVLAVLSQERPAGAKSPAQAINIVNFMGGPPGTLQAIQRAGVPCCNFTVRSRDVGPARQELAAIAARTKGPIVLTGWSRGGRVALALTSMSRKAESGFQGRIKGLILFAPEVKTQHKAWKTVFGTPLPDHATVLAHAGRMFGRAKDDLQQIDEIGQETRITTPTLIFTNRNDNVVSWRYQKRIAQDPSNTGVTAFIASQGDHFNVNGRTLQLVSSQASKLLQTVANETVPPPVPASERVTSY